MTLLIFVGVIMSWNRKGGMSNLGLGVRFYVSGHIQVIKAAVSNVSSGNEKCNWDLCQKASFYSLLIVCLSYPSTETLCIGLCPIRLSTVQRYYSGSVSANSVGSDSRNETCGREYVWME